MRREAGRCSGIGICVASVGNLIDYVPIRTFTDGTDLYQDMFAVEKGFGWSPWTLLVLFGIPTVCVVAYFSRALSHGRCAGCSGSHEVNVW